MIKDFIVREYIDPWLRFRIIQTSRVKDVRDFYNGSVAEWAKKYEY